MLVGRIITCRALGLMRIAHLQSISSARTHELNRITFTHLTQLAFHEYVPCYASRVNRQYVLMQSPFSTRWLNVPLRTFAWYCPKQLSSHESEILKSKYMWPKLELTFDSTREYGGNCSILSIVRLALLIAFAVEASTSTKLPVRNSGVTTRVLTMFTGWTLKIAELYLPLISNTRSWYPKAGKWYVLGVKRLACLRKQWHRR